MIWPERPTCHENETQTPDLPVMWTTFSNEHFRRCMYCGSMHPEDLLTALADGGWLETADRKYGWPHKNYVRIRNPFPDRIVEIGSESHWDDDLGRRVTTTMTGRQGQWIHAKWYNVHLLDAGYDQEARSALQAALYAHSGVRFWIDDQGRLMYSK